MSIQSTPVWEHSNSMRLRWIVWSLCVVVWTIGLLTPYPVQAGKEIMSPSAEFPASKGLHIVAYAVLMMGALWLRLRGAGLWLVVGFLAVHGCLTEYFQNYVPTRTGTVRDAFLDFLGVAIGVVVFWKYSQRHEA